MPFKDLDDFFHDSLDLPIGAKIYSVPSPDATLGLWCQRVLGAGISIANGGDPDTIPNLPQELDDQEERDLYVRLLGPVWDQLQADGVSWERIRMVGQTAFIWVGGSRELAEQFWNSGGDPKASAPNRSARRAGSTSTAAGGTTPPLVSGNGTRSHKTGTARSGRPGSPGK
jgi:hypothetical protein